MKKTSLVLGIVLVVLFFSVNSVFAFAGGNGSEGSPYQVATAADLDSIRNAPYLTGNYYFIQTTDIDLTAACAVGGDYWYGGLGWEPIGDNTTPFTGQYDGSEHTIDGLFINRPLSDYIGLFGQIDGATIKNLGTINVDITGVTAAVGGLVGRNSTSSTIDNCYSTGTTVSGIIAVGGLVGYNDMNCKSQAPTGQLSLSG